MLLLLLLLLLLQMKEDMTLRSAAATDMDRDENRITRRCAGRRLTLGVQRPTIPGVPILRRVSFVRRQAPLIRRIN